MQPAPQVRPQDTSLQNAMLNPVPFCRESGTGPGVVCVHANASSSSQWCQLMEVLAPHHFVLAPDTHGAGKGPAWPADLQLDLSDEVALLEPVFSRAGTPFSLVGHSYGGAVALVAAVQQPQRVRSLVLYEPTLFALVDAAFTPPNDADGIRHTVERAGVALAAGDPGAAAEHFIDFWMGKGTWRATLPARRSSIEGAIVNVQGWGQALFGETTPLQAFEALTMPVLLMVGRDSPPSTRAVARLLAQTLPRLETLEFEGIGHMGPVTHVAVVNPVIEEFLRRNAAE